MLQPTLPLKPLKQPRYWVGSLFYIALHPHSLCLGICIGDECFQLLGDGLASQSAWVCRSCTGSFLLLWFPSILVQDIMVFEILKLRSLSYPSPSDPIVPFCRDHLLSRKKDSTLVLKFLICTYKMSCVNISSLIYTVPLCVQTSKRPLHWFHE